MLRLAFVILLMTCTALVQSARAQTIEITGLPAPGAAGQITGTVTGLDHSTSEVAAYLYIEGGGWWTKPNFGMPTVPIDPDGSFSINIGTGGSDELASMYTVSVVPTGTTPPQMEGASTLDLGVNSTISTYEQRFGTNLQFANRNWGVKESPSLTGPGPNRFSTDSDDVWVDQDGLHLTIQNHSGQWYSTEVVLTENLGYGTYIFQTSTRQDILDANATFGAFTWDVFGDDDRIPAWPNREIDFEDTRWGDPLSPTNAQTVVQPWWVPGALNQFTLPDLSGDDSLTRFFTWAPGRVEFYTLLGHHQPNSFPLEAIINHTVYLDDGGTHIVPEPGRENFRFNLWLNQPAPAGAGPLEVIVNDFVYAPPGDFDYDGDVDGNDFLIWQQGESPNPLSQSDLVDWEMNYGALFPLSAVSTAVPEPATVSLLGCVLLMSGTLVRRRVFS